MSTLVIILILASFVTVTQSRVTFTYSEVLQESDLDDNFTAPFKCDNGCQIYSDSQSDEIFINDGLKDVLNFHDMGPPDLLSPANQLAKSKDYTLVYRGKDKTPPRFVFYAVDKKSPNLDTKVFSANGEPGYLSYTEAAGMFTLLRSYDPATYIVFDGNFTDGYPRIYATGFDATSEAACSPVYTARSEDNALNSMVTVPSPILTVVNGPHLGMADPNHQPQGTFNKLSPNSSVVYISPGYVGCSYIKDHMYYSATQTVHDSFSVDVTSLDFTATVSIPNADEAVHITVNKEKLDLSGVKPVEEHFDADRFDVTIDWTRKTATSSFALQIDLGAPSEEKSTTKSNPDISSTTGITPTTSSSHGTLALTSMLIVVCTVLA